MPYASLVTPPLTTVRVPRYELGQAAARKLLDLMAGRPGGAPEPPLALELVVRRARARRARARPESVSARDRRPTGKGGARRARRRSSSESYGSRGPDPHDEDGRGDAMSDPEDIERSDGEHGGLSRRAMLRLGMLALSATQLPVAASAQGAKPGAHLIGKLEGAEVVTDPAQVPKRFNEAPQLAELVKAGKLPAGRAAHRPGPAGHQAAPRDRPLRRDLAPRLHRAVRLLERPPRRPERQAPLLGLHRHQARPEHRPRLGGQPRTARSRRSSCAGA